LAVKRGPIPEIASSGKSSFKVEAISPRIIARKASL
jgi:hypothetical protein